MSVPVVTTQGSLILTARAGNRSIAFSLAGTLRLFTSDTTPTVDSVVGDFTEATFSGYSRRAVANDSFQPAALDGGDAVAPNTGNPFQWTCGTTGQTVRGWLYVANTGELIVAEKFTNPQVLTDGVRLTLEVSLVGTPKT